MRNNFLISNDDIQKGRDHIVKNDIFCGMVVIYGKNGKSLVSVETDSPITRTNCGFPDQDYSILDYVAPQSDQRTDKTVNEDAPNVQNREQLTDEEFDKILNWKGF